MKIFITLSKRSLAVILACVIIALIIIGKFFSVGAAGIDGSTNAKRVEYITGLGYSVNETCVSSKTIVIPEEFDDVYKKYNLLQAEADFDLSAYKGRSAEIYSYSLSDDERTVTLIICEGRVIGGDISSPRIDGEMESLKPKNE